MVATHPTGFTVTNLQRTVWLFNGYRERMHGKKTAEVAKSVPGIKAPIKAASAMSRSRSSANTVVPPL